MKPTSYVLNHKRLHADVYTDTMFGKCKSLNGNTCCQTFATDYHYIMAYPMKSKSDCHMTLKDFFKDVGVPRVLIPTQNLTEHHRTSQKFTECRIKS
jgi:hypothetical protein